MSSCVYFEAFVDVLARGRLCWKYWWEKKQAGCHLKKKHLQHPLQGDEKKNTLFGCDRDRSCKFFNQPNTCEEMSDFTPRLVSIIHAFTN